MTDTKPVFEPLVRLQRVMWVLFTLAYAGVTALYVAESSFATLVATWTTVALLVLTGAKLIYIGSYFQQSGLKRHLVLTILLALLLLSAALWEIF